MLNIIAIKTKKGYYISDKDKVGEFSCGNLEYYYYDGKKPENTFDRKWFFIENIPEKVEKEIRLPNINKRFELMDLSLESENIPAIISYDNAGVYDDEYCCFIWNDKYKKYSSLYEEKSDKQDSEFEELEFSFEVLLEYDVDYINKSKFEVNASNDRYGNKAYKITSPEHQLLDKIVFPSILLHTKKSRLTSKQVYDILRYEIRKNINPKYAVIGSDFDFCFSVSKRLKLSEPYIVTEEIKKSNGRSYKNPKIREIYTDDKNIKCFEMTSEKDMYKGYTPIRGIEAENEEELQIKIEKLCKCVIDKINEPLIEYPHCKGRGVIIDEDTVKIEVNKI
jgi:hypothetical protein